MGFRDAQPRGGAVAAKPQAAAAPAGRNEPKGVTGRGQLKPTAGRYSGLKLSDPRFPILEPGNGYVLKILHTRESKIAGKKPWMKTQVEVLESQNGVEPGSKRSILKCCSDEAFEMSGPEIKNMVMACLGFDDEGEFEAQHEDWATMIDAVHGVEAAEKEHGVNPLEGLTARCDAIPQGEFINCVWAPPI